jgi:hypothetical protein
LFAQVWISTSPPINRIGQQSHRQIRPQIVTLQIDRPALRNIRVAGNRRGDERAFIVPQPTVGRMLEFSGVNVEADAA